MIPKLTVHGDFNVRSLVLGTWDASKLDEATDDDVVAATAL